MKRSRILLVILAMLAGLLVTSSAMARPAARVFTVKHFVCSQTGGKQWVSGSTLHLRGLSNSGQLVSTEPRLAGSSVIIFNADLNASTMAGVGSGTVVFLPAADNIHGSWRGTFQEKNPATPPKRTGTAFLRGTDDLRGLELTITIKGTTDVSDAPPACPNPVADIMTVHIWSTR
jgi:hypothetical protein